jgi:hypothetical protein
MINANLLTIEIDPYSLLMWQIWGGQIEKLGSTLGLNLSKRGLTTSS